MLHGRRTFGDATADQAHVLLTTFYRDHELFYSHKQNYVLHLHLHYAELYRNHGSLSNINTFSQEDIKAYAEANNLQWREDSSNASTKYLRNALRKEVIPKLKAFEVQPPLN